MPRDGIAMEVSAQMDPRADRPGHENVPVYPHVLTDTVQVDSSASTC
jgi:hypothetical protein